MSKKIAAVFVLILAMGGLYAQKKSHTKAFAVKISGTIRSFSGPFIYLHHKWEDGDYTDSAKIEAGKFAFNLTSVDPNMYWFSLTREIGAQPNVIFFVDKTPLTARLLGDSLSSSTVSGGETQKDFLDYRRLGEDFVQLQQKLQADYTIANQKGDVGEINKIQFSYQEVGTKYISDLKSFVKAHSKSAVSGYIIYKEFNNPNIPVEQAEECLGYLDKSMEATKFGRLAKKRVQDLKGTVVGAQATDFYQNTADGKRVHLSDFKGQYVLVDFWASWCRPCRMENPNVVSVYNRYKDKGFTVLGVSLDSNKEQWEAAVKADNLVWTQVSDLKGGANEAALLFGIQTIPQNLFLDRSGKIIAKNLRGQALEEKLAEVIK